MRIHLFGLLLGMGIAANLAAQEPISAELLRDIKSATVYIKVRLVSLEATGSGFFIKAKNGASFVVTNEHVVVPLKRDGFPTSSKSRPSTWHANVVVRSGEPDEKVFKADVVAADAEIDLALLRLRDAKDLPKPLDHSQPVELMETLPVLIVGFPFGQDLSESKRNPAITVGRGSVSSLRNDDRGERKVIQIDGDVNPGNSGGPVVDAKGRLVGVAVAKIRGTRIGMAIPPQQITKLFTPQVTGVVLANGKVTDNVMQVGVTAQIGDPLGKIKSVSLRYADARGRHDPAKSPRDKAWQPIHDARVADLEINDLKAKGNLSVNFETDMVALVVQPVVTMKDDTVVAGIPSLHTLERLRAGAAVRKDRSKAPADSERPKIMIEKGDDASTAKPKDKLKSHNKIIGAGVPSGSMCWSADGGSFYHLDQAGMLRRMSFPDLNELASAQLEINANPWLNMSAVGVVVSGCVPIERAKPRAAGRAVPDLGRVIVLEPNELKVVRTVSLPLVYRAVSSPKSTLAYASVSPMQNANKDLLVIDLAEGSIVKKYRSVDLGFPEPCVDRMVASPDGKWLISRDDERMFRYRVDGTEVRLDETSPRMLHRNYEELVINANGTFIRATCNLLNPSEQRKSTSTCPTQIFAIERLSQPAQVIEMHNYSEIAAFDPSAGHLYVLGHSGVEIFSVNGSRLGNYDLREVMGQRREVKQILVHPQGRQFVLLMNEPDSKSQRVVTLELPPL